jgi:hypothetical protein
MNTKLWISTWIFEKVVMAPKGYSPARGKLIHEPNLESKISCKTPFNLSDRIKVHPFLCISTSVRGIVRNDSLLLCIFCPFRTKFCWFIASSFNIPRYSVLISRFPACKKMLYLKLIKYNFLYICKVDLSKSFLLMQMVLTTGRHPFVSVAMSKQGHTAIQYFLNCRQLRENSWPKKFNLPRPGTLYT